MRVSISIAFFISFIGEILSQLQVAKVCVFKVQYSPRALLTTCNKCSGRDKIYTMIDCAFSKMDFSSEKNGVYRCSNQYLLSPSIAFVCNHPKDFSLCAVVDGVEAWMKYNYTMMQPLKIVRCSNGDYDFKLACKLSSTAYIACAFSPEQNEYLKDLTGHELPATLNFRGDMISADFAENGILMPASLIDSLRCIPEAEKVMSCDFYETCLESAYSCGSAGYPLGYGKKYCKKFLEHYFVFSAPAQRWIDDTLLCLKRALKTIALGPKDSYTCDSIKSVAFQSHPGCYVDSGFCEMLDIDFVGQEGLCQNLKGLWEVYEIKEFSEAITWDQVIKAFSLCEAKGAPIDKVKLGEMIIKCDLHAPDCATTAFAENGIVMPTFLVDNMKCIQEVEKERSCDFFEDCIEKTFSCGSEGYPLGYGKKYCSKFLDYYTVFPMPAQKWIDDAIICLKRALKPIAIAQNYSYTCGEIKSIAFDSHSKCFIEAGFCEMLDVDFVGLEGVCKTLMGIWQVYEIKEISEVTTWEEVTKTLALCEAKGAPIDKVKMEQMIVQCGLTTAAKALAQ